MKFPDWLDPGQERTTPDGKSFSRRRFFRKAGRKLAHTALAASALIAARHVIDSNRTADTTEYRYGGQRDELRGLTSSIIERMGYISGSVDGAELSDPKKPRETYHISITPGTGIQFRCQSPSAWTIFTDRKQAGELQEYRSSAPHEDFQLMRNPSGTLTVLRKHPTSHDWRTVDDADEKYFHLRRCNDQYLQVLRDINRMLALQAPLPQKTHPINEARRKLLRTLRNFGKATLPKQ